MFVQLSFGKLRTPSPSLLREQGMYSSSPVILIIDSDPIMLTGVAAVLNMQGHECHCASDETAAIKAADDLPLDLIICDVNIHGKSGIELCNRLQDECGHTDVPVMLVSGTQVADIVRRAHEAGGAYYLRKPFDPDVLIELVDKALWMPHLVRSRIEHEEEAIETQSSQTPSQAVPNQAVPSQPAQDQPAPGQTTPSSTPSKSSPKRRPGRREATRESIR
jgi:CheY-like chemotaxis protein